MLWLHEKQVVQGPKVYTNLSIFLVKVVQFLWL